MKIFEKGGYIQPENPEENAASIQALQQMGIQVSSDNTYIKLTDSPFRAYKLNGGDPNKAFNGIGVKEPRETDRMVGISLKNSSHLTITYADGTVSKFHIGTTPPPKPEQNQGPTLAAMQNKFNAGVPGGVMSKYDVALKNKSTVVINKPEEEMSNSKALVLRNDKGGIDFSPSNNEEFKSLDWKSESVAQINHHNITDVNGKQLQLQGGNGQANTLNWKSNTDAGKIVFLDTGIVSICEQSGAATYIPINAPASDWSRFGGMAKKPVIYLYPKQTTKITVSVELKGATMVAEYPKTQKGEWKVEATPRGNLTDLSNSKKYSYLFWEAEKAGGFQMNTSNAHCVASADITEYLEKSLKTLGLNAREANDFMVYWLPVLEKNPYSVIEWKSTEYTDMAKLHISPKPDTTIRVFMVFHGSEKDVKTGNPKLQKASRKGYSVIEWGGCNMDEGSKIK